MSFETNSANEIRANWLELKFKLIINWLDFVCEPGPGDGDVCTYKGHTLMEGSGGIMLTAAEIWIH